MYKEPEGPSCTQALSPLGGGSQYIPPTRRQQLENKRAILQQELVKVTAALEALDKHPDLEEFAEVIARAGV